MQSARRPARRLGRSSSWLGLLIREGGGPMRSLVPVPRAALRLAVAFAVLACLPRDASGQYFGRNKVEYEHFKWQVLKTEHFNIHFYPEEESAVREAARMAERWYTRLSSVFGPEF